MKDVLLNALSKKDKNYAGILLFQPTTPFRNLKKFNRYLKNFKIKLVIIIVLVLSIKLIINYRKKLFFFKKGKVCYQTGSLILISMKSFFKKEDFKKQTTLSQLYLTFNMKILTLIILKISIELKKYLKKFTKPFR